MARKGTPKPDGKDNPGDEVPESLGKRVKVFAQKYVALTDALMREGVPEEVAREEARLAALSWMYNEPTGPVCPLCGNPTY